MIPTAIAIAVAGLSALVAHAIQGSRGLLGACAGIGIALLMCSVSGFILRWASRARGRAILAGMLGSVASSFLILIAAVVLVNIYWRPALESATLTALATYLGYRFVEAFSFASLVRAEQPARGGGSR